MLLILSIIFYGLWRWDFALLMILSALVDYLASLKIATTTQQARKKAWLIVSLSVNLGLLVFFKYAYFIDNNLQAVCSIFGFSYSGLTSLPVTIILPLGISFYTFQTISYTIDVYRGNQVPTKDFALFATYVTFWPQLVAGPILRGSEVIPQFQTKQPFVWSNLNGGAYLVLVGLVKKVVLADNVALLVDEGFQLNTAFMSGWDVWILAILFGFQIYFDFSGYSDIAIGSAKMMGFHFPDNFSWPYFAKTPREFWRRWHISLSSWIRDYLYLPLLGVKFKGHSEGGLYIPEAARSNMIGGFTGALFITWIFMGFWHGAGWNFGIWGLYHAVMIFLFRKVGVVIRLADKFPMASGIVTFFLMMASWIPFRSKTVERTGELYMKMINPFSYAPGLGQLHISYLFYTIMILLGMTFLYFLYKQPRLRASAEWVKLAGVPVMVLLIIVYMQQVVQFIYFQF